MTTVGSCPDVSSPASLASSSGSSSATSGTCVSSAVVCDMRWMNSTDPSAKPTTIASVSPLNKVMPNVANTTAASPRDALGNVAKASRSNMFQHHDCELSRICSKSV